MTGAIRMYSDYWWLRSPGITGSDASAVTSVGTVSALDASQSRALRPAFNLDLSSVLFTSDTSGAGAKSSATAGGDFVGVTGTSGAVKLTVEDSGLNLSTPAATSVSGRTITFGYSFATSGITLSAIVEDSAGIVKYYGKLEENLNPSGVLGAGTATVTVPEDFAATDTLKIFVEECNGDSYTDFASTPVVLTNFTNNPTAPSGLTGAACTTAANNDGKITGTTADMEYSADSGATWADCTATETTGLAGGTYLVRTKASGTTLASPSAAVTIGAYSTPSSPSSPSSPSTANPQPNPTTQTELPSGGTVETADNTPPVIDDNGIMTLPGGGKIETPSGVVVDVPAGTEIAPDGTITIGAGGGSITFADNTSRNLPEGLEIILDEDVPLGFFVTGLPFADVDAGAWYFDDVAFAYLNGLFAGTGADTFSPNMPMTRSMVVTVLGRLAGIDVADYSGDSFDDVDAAQWYAPYVKWAAEMGIVSGVGNNNYAPDANISRQDLAVILNNYAKVMGITLPETVDAVVFNDDTNINGYAKEAVAAMQKAGIVSGKGGGIFDPAGNATRAEVAAMLHRFVEVVQ